MYNVFTFYTKPPLHLHSTEFPLFRSKKIPCGILMLRNSVFNGIPRNFTEFRIIFLAESKNSVKFRLYGIPLTLKLYPICGCNSLTYWPLEVFFKETM